MPIYVSWCAWSAPYWLIRTNGRGEALYGLREPSQRKALRPRRLASRNVKKRRIASRRGRLDEPGRQLNKYLACQRLAETRLKSTPVIIGLTFAAIRAYELKRGSTWWSLYTSSLGLYPSKLPADA